MNRAAIVMALLLVSARMPAQARRDTMPAAPAAERILIRSLTGYLLAAPLVAVGGTIGYHYERAHYFCKCDDPGLQGMVIGGMLGLVVGSTLATAIPALGTGCSFKQRLGRSFLGTMGTVAIAVGAAAATGGGGIVVTLAAPVGGAVAQGRC